MMLVQLLEDIENLDGVVCYSLNQLPSDNKTRNAPLGAVIAAGRSVHFAVESISVKDWADTRRVEDIVQARPLLPTCLSLGKLRAVVRAYPDG